MRTHSMVGARFAQIPIQYGQQMTTYTYQTIEFPGSVYTHVDSINASGEIVGYYQNSNHAVQYGFLDDNGIYTTINPPGSIGVISDDINSQGQIVGVYETASGPQLGFLYDNGTYTTIDPPGASLLVSNLIGPPLSGPAGMLV
jgi:probable HAF family extracellular repeat protein